MSDTTSHRDLDQRIEQLVREHITAVQRSAREALDRAFADAAMPKVVDAEPECTGVAAVRCPRCGDCACPRNEYGERTLEDENCPLHGESSQHATEPAIDHEAEAASLRIELRNALKAYDDEVTGRREEVTRLHADLRGERERLRQVVEVNARNKLAYEGNLAAAKAERANVGRTLTDAEKLILRAWETLSSEAKDAAIGALLDAAAPDQLASSAAEVVPRPCVRSDGPATGTRDQQTG